MLPFAFINVASSVDGKIAPANRHFVPFGSRYDQALLFELRARADAVIAGARTIDSAPGQYGPGPAKYRRQRVARGLAEYNLRVIVSGSGTVNPQADVFRHRFAPILVITSGRARPGNLRRLRAVADAVETFGDQELDFAAAFRWLREQWNVRRLLCEGGGELNEALLRRGLVHEIYLTLCPLIIGGREAPTLADGTGVSRVGDAIRVRLKSVRKIGHELFLVYSVRRRIGGVE